MLFITVMIIDIIIIHSRRASLDFPSAVTQPTEPPLTWLRL